MLNLLKTRIVLFVIFLSILYFGYRYYFLSDDVLILSPPSVTHWLGTDLTGSDVLLNSINGFFLEWLTLLIVLPLVYYGGLTIGMTLSYFNNDMIGAFLQNMIRYWITLPILLIALFLLVLFGGSQKNAIIVIIFLYIPTQAIYVYNQLEIVKKKEFIITSLSYGFSKKYIYIKHILPNIKKELYNYTFARTSEIIMMNLSLNFLGLGVQAPFTSLGRMLFDGLSFMFSAWWLWCGAVILVIIMFLIMNYIRTFIFMENLK